MIWYDEHSKGKSLKNDFRDFAAGFDRSEVTQVVHLSENLFDCWLV